MKKLRIIVSLFFCSILSIALGGQTQGFSIKIKYPGYSLDTMWFGKVYGKRSEPILASGERDGEWFVLKSDQPTPSGMYAILYKPGARGKFLYVPILLSDTEREFQIEFSPIVPTLAPTVTGSLENDFLFQFNRKFDKLTDIRDSLAFEFRDVGDDVSLINLRAAEQNVRDYQEKFIRDHPGQLVSELVGKFLYPVPPIEGKTIEEKEKNRWFWLQKNYFERFDMTDPAFTTGREFVEFLDYYVFKCPPKEPDSVKIAVLDVFKRLEKANPEFHHYYFKYAHDSFAKMSKYRADELWAWLYRDFVEKGLAPWTKPEELRKMKKDIEKFERLFVGKQGPDVTLSDRAGNAMALSEFKSPYLLLVFWNPDCGHCKKELPILQRLLVPYQVKGLQVVSICGKTQEQAKMCWEFADQNPFPDTWKVLNDPLGKAALQSQYNVTSFPRMFLMDSNRTILWKRNGEVPERELERVFNRFVK